MGVLKVKVDEVWTEVASAVPTGPYTPLDQSTWTWVNQGGATVTQGGGVVLLEGPSQAGRNTRMRVMPTPPTPWTITACVIPLLLSSANYAWGGIGLRESSTGKIIDFYRVQSANVEAYKNTNETVGSAVLGTPLVLGMPSTQPIWLRIRDDGTNLVYWFSFDGVHFIPYASEGRTAFMASGPNQVGIVVACQGGALQKLSVLSWKQTT